MPNFGELQQKVSRDMKSTGTKSPYKPEILAQAEEEPANLRKFLFSMNTMFSEEFIEDALFTVGDWFHDHMRKTIALQYRSWLYGEHLKVQRVYVPKNWFEHLKERVLPAFLKEYWPVKMQYMEVDIRALYPKLRRKLTMPEELHVVHGVRSYGEDEEE